MKQINIGIVGFGGIAKIHAIACHAMQVLYEDLPFLPTMKKAYRRNNQGRNGIFSETVTSLEDLLNDAVIDLVDICTPNYLHYEQVKKSLEYNKAVYCEKPLALNYQQAQALANLAEQKKLVNQVALMYRFMPAVVMAREYIQEGSLGEIIHFKFALYHKGYLNENRPLSWRQQMDYAGGGALMDLGIHMADLVRYMLGEVQGVQAHLYTHYKERFISAASGQKGRVDVDEYAQVDVKLKQGGMGIIECSRITSDLHENTVIEIYGTKGSIKITSQDPRYPTIHQHERNVSYKGELGENSPFYQYYSKIYPIEKVSLGLTIDMHLASLYNLFFNIAQERIVYDETPTFYEAALAQKVIEMALLSHCEDNRWVKWEEL